MSINRSLEDAQEAKNYFNYYITIKGHTSMPSFVFCLLVIATIVS